MYIVIQHIILPDSCFYCEMFVAATVGNQLHFDYNVQQTNGIDGKAQRRGMYSLLCITGLCCLMYHSNVNW